ncbi:biotin transporter BioY [Paenibacillus sambharensis]|uniref:Biotin transporter n=1 Tax=Paenibacillus sambharensis TaxID=1803190 RepID=A0A2W1L0F8_9BACL|nr:biotin transporter BioY [Paenibacillus sambharensis]PZD93398.1 biotin transporter BioY [Paenibacillus sambharensis]
MSLNVRSLVYTALFSALFVVFTATRFTLGFSDVPITLQNLAVMLAGAFLGARYGLISMGLVVALIAVGVPIGGEGGISRILGPTGGFLFAFLIEAMLIGYLVRKVIASRRKLGISLFYAALFLVFVLAGVLPSYVIGVPWHAAVKGFTITKSLTLACYPFIPFDIAKAVIATVVTGAMYRYIPKLHSRHTAEKSGLRSEMHG